MKKTLSFLLVVMLFLFMFSGCTGGTDSGSNISDYITNENGKYTLTLPVSKTTLDFPDEYTSYLEDLDADLLKEAEEEIIDNCSEYSGTPVYYIDEEDDYLCLCVEIIEPIESADGSDKGCGIDHEHIFLRERISK